MRHIDFEFNGKTYALSFTAEALFTVYETFGVCDSILDATKAFEPTEEGWKNCCWLLALMASQGELQRRHMGEEPMTMLTLEDLRTGFMAADVPYARAALKACLQQGFRREIPDGDGREEINLVLQEREAATKKAKQLARSALNTLRQLLTSFTSASKRRSS